MVLITIYGTTVPNLTSLKFSTQNPNFQPASCRNCKSWKCLNWFHIFLEQQSLLKGAIFALFALFAIFALFSLFVKSNSDCPGSDRQLCHPCLPTSERDQSNVKETVYLSGSNLCLNVARARSKENFSHRISS